MDESPAWLETKLGERIAVKGSCSVGRAGTNTLMIPSERVSRRHALFHRHGDGEYLLVDLGSSNGTFVNGRRIDHMIVLHDGDMIEIGPKKLIFRRGEAAEEDDIFAEETPSPEAEPCWLLVASTENADSSKYESVVEESLKTVASWSIECDRTVERLGGTVVRHSGEDLFAYWKGAESDLQTTQKVVNALDRLCLLQSRTREQFRLTLHHAKVLIEPSKSQHENSLEGSGVTLAFHLQRLAWKLSVPCLLSKAAAVALAPLKQSQPLDLGESTKQPLFTC